MTKKYLYTTSHAERFNKHGIDVTVYGMKVPHVNVVHISVTEGHFQEFIDIKSYYIYYIIQGAGIFVLNDEKSKVIATDLIAIPPNTRIHYFGTMELIVTASPAFNEKNERRVRFVDKKESPYYGK